MNQGYIYVLSNPSMDGLLKIGKTTRDPFQRAKELHTTGVATPFKVEFSIYDEDITYLEQAIHYEISHLRVSGKREFFKIELMEFIEHYTIVKTGLGLFDPGLIMEAGELQLNARKAGMLIGDFRYMISKIVPEKWERIKELLKP